jgi:two-component system heavy metal sensor histidine kinase CusS
MNAYRRMTWGLSLLTLITLGVAFMAISLVLDRYQERQLDESLLKVATEEAVEAPENEFSFTTRPGPAANDVGPLEKYGIIFDENGHPISFTHPFDKGAGPLPDFHLAELEQPFDFVYANHPYRGVLVRIPSFPTRKLFLAASREDLDGDSRFVRRAMIIALAFSVLWLIGAIRWLVNRNMREHQRVAEILHRVATGDVKARVAKEEVSDDLRVVAGDVDEIAQKLAALIDHQRRFIAHAAHELRSPLAALHGEIQQALRKERSGDEYRTSLAFLLRASARLKHLADELLGLARAEIVTRKPEPVSLDLALADVVDSLAPLAKEKGIKIVRDPTSCAVLAVRDDIERVLRNLLDNAIKHSPSGGVVRLEIETGEKVNVRVRDEGRGVRPEDREMIFEPFHRGPAERADGDGAGLGLAIARELARRHGGDVVAGPDPTCFTFSLRRVRNQPAAA